MQMGPRQGGAGESVSQAPKEDAIPEIQIEDTQPEGVPPEEPGKELKVENIPF
ncbi:hypothetical protein HYV98_01495 [Candidatus Azambacteria bacterium]|nr:hypothetical protein [Candidatus Azambacteria bacterium]